MTMLNIHRSYRPSQPPLSRITLLTGALIYFLIIYSYAHKSNPDSPASSSRNEPDIEKNNREFKALEAVDLIRNWVLRFGNAIHSGTEETTCVRSIRDQFDPAKGDPRRNDYRAAVKSNDWTRQHGEFVNLISNTMSWHKIAVENIAQAAESLAGNHSFSPDLRFEYHDVHRIINLDEEETNYQGAEFDSTSSSDTPLDTNELNGTDLRNNQEIGQLDSDGQLINTATDSYDSTTTEPLPKPSELVQSPKPDKSEPLNLPPIDEANGEWQTSMKPLKLERHKNFDDIPINTEESVVHVPVHIFPGDPQVMNGIAWSDGLTKVFQNNFVWNRKLTNQYFAAQSGFMRLFPAQKWQIQRDDPDLYDARMRPWYVSGASSRKDVIILVDSSGSMTGSRRDIAKGVVFEILDTLTDDDHFIILKFSDTIQQVGVPACPRMEVERKNSDIPTKNTYQQNEPNDNGTNIDSFYLTPANGKNVRLVKTNFTIATSGIANFSQALVTAFEILRKYQGSERVGSQCNQAIMLITDGSPSSFDEIFSRYNVNNAPFRVFTYLIGREAGDVTNTKMMACHNRGFYTHVINLAEVRETVQQYIPVMARPLVLTGIHPIVWTPSYGDLTYQILTDWVWESRRRNRARAILSERGTSSNNVPSIQVTSGEADSDIIDSDRTQMMFEHELDNVDLFGYNRDSRCFWETRRNDFMTTVVQPVYDTKNETWIEEKQLVRNVFEKTKKLMRTANLLGVAAADLKIDDIIALAPSHKIGPNGYAVILTNNGFVMHHPGLRSLLEPIGSDLEDRHNKLLKPFFSSVDFTEIEHVFDKSSVPNLTALRREAVYGLTGWRELTTKRTVDCQRRVQIRKQKFYYKPIRNTPFSFMIAIPQPYGSHRIDAQVEIKSASLPEKLSTYFTASDYDFWTVHPNYQYCDGPSNITVTTLLDMFQRIDERKLDDIQWRATESSKPPQFLLSGKIVCDKDLVQSLVYDAVATYGFSDNCGLPLSGTKSNLIELFGARFSFISTRSGLTRVRQFDIDDPNIKREALSFAKYHARTVDETFYQRTVDYNMIVNETAVLVQVPFNTYERIANLDSSLNYNTKDMDLIEKLQTYMTNSSLYAIATQSVIVNEGNQRAVAAVTGVFYDYAKFVLRLLNSTNDAYMNGRRVTKLAQCYAETSSNDEQCNDSKNLKCGYSNDTIDCLIVDNNGFIVVSEDLEFIGRHLKAYDSSILAKLVGVGVFQEVNITDHQAICMKSEERQQASSALRSLFEPLKVSKLVALNWLLDNFITAVTHSWTILSVIVGSLFPTVVDSYQAGSGKFQQQPLLPTLALLPNRTYLRPCEKVMTLYDFKPKSVNSDKPEYYRSRCGCESWFVHEHVPSTNLLMIIVDTTTQCRLDCHAASVEPDSVLDTKETIIGSDEEQVCSMLEQESRLYSKRSDSCFKYHPDEEYIKLCGAACKTAQICGSVLISMLFLSVSWLLSNNNNYLHHLVR